MREKWPGLGELRRRACLSSAVLLLEGRPHLVGVMSACISTHALSEQRCSLPCPPHWAGLTASTCCRSKDLNVEVGGFVYPQVWVVDMALSCAWAIDVEEAVRVCNGLQSKFPV